MIDYLCAENRARKCDFVILDAITANRKGPLNGSEVNIGKKTDYIETNAILASTDPVAIDTVETLLAGYDIESVKLLGAASRDGLGESRPSRIMVAGFERFGEHRAAISREYAPRKKTGKKEGTWPLEDGIGGARIRIDIEPPAIVRAEATRMQQDLWRVAYEANDDRSGKSSLARIDVLLHGARIASIFDCTESGCVEVQIPSADGAPNPLELVVWDAALNASRSPIETRSPNPTESGR